MNCTRRILCCVLFLTVSSFVLAREPLPESLAFLEKQRVPEWTAAFPDSWSIIEPATGTNENGLLTLDARGEHESWRSSALSAKPNSLVRFYMQATTAGGTGTSPSGVFGCTRDYAMVGSDTLQDMMPYTCQLARDAESFQLVCGQWQSHGQFRFAKVQARPVVPVFCGIDSSDVNRPNTILPLAAGEVIDNGHYSSRLLLAGGNGNYGRSLVSHNANFNTDRWVLSHGSSIIYKISLTPWQCGEQGWREETPLSLLNLSFDLSVVYHTAGRCLLEASLDGEQWQLLEQLESTGSIQVANVNELLASPEPTEVWFRIRAEGTDGGTDANLQVSSLQVSADLNTPAFQGNGSTVYLTTAGESQAHQPELIPLYFDRNYAFHALVLGKTPTETALTALLPEVSCEGMAFPRNEKDWSLQTIPLADSSSEMTEVVFGYKGHFETKPYLMKWASAFPFQYEITIPNYLNQNYTRAVADANGTANQVSLSWCEQDYKVPKNSVFTQIQSAAPIALTAAGNDFESFQVVVHADGGTPDLEGVTGTVTDAVDEAGHRIPVDRMDLRYAWYHKVVNPTDEVGSPGWWPDALVPLEKGSDGRGAPLLVTSGCNQPIWLTVQVPEGTPAGTYRSTLTLKSSDGRLDITIPWQITVWNFSLPVKNRLETAFGMNIWNAFLYQNCKTDEDRRAALELYLKNFSEHRISPYNCVPMDSYHISWNKESDPPTATIDFSQFDKELKRVMEKYHFTNLVTPVPGLGGGTYQSRYLPNIEGFGEETPEFQALFSSMMSQLQNHLDELGILDGCYIYWFDEPEPKDYDFVANGFALLKKYGPKIPRMLTEEPSDKFCETLKAKGANIDIWCPISPNFSEPEAAKRKAEGERFWWYVCTGPKAPFCTLFIDHPATDLRVWHWQTFERDIVGTLVWESLYWTSSTAFPDSFQNPYTDPMSYVAGGEPGTRSFWGNGDGRFVYPPLAAAVPGLNEGKPVIEEPVSSIRWEMIREGVEDYHLLLMLRELSESRADLLTDSQRQRLADIFDLTAVTQDVTHFTIVPGPIYEKRQKIAELIEELQSEL